MGDEAAVSVLAESGTPIRVFISYTHDSVAHKASDLYAGMSRKVQERVEAVQDALAERRYRQQIAAGEGAAS